MTNEQMRDIVKECGLDWNKGYIPIFDGDPTNRYAVLIEVVVEAEREACAKLCELGLDTSPGAETSEWSKAHNNACKTRAIAIRLRGHENNT